MTTTSQHISIDIETAGCAPDAIILSIGAVAFNPHGPAASLPEAGPGDALHIPIGLKGNPQGRGFQAATLEWWEQHPHRRETFFPQEYMALDPALRNLALWVQRQSGEETLIWMRGPQFDGVILENAYNGIRMPAPWKFWQLRDVRTACDLALPKLPQRTTAQHHALEDAIYQARCVQQVYTRMRHIQQFDELRQTLANIA